MSDSNPQPDHTAPNVPAPAVRFSLVQGERPARIIVSDDVDTVRRTFRVLLRHFFTDHQVVTCADGDRAWQEINRQPPDLLITDYQHPGMPLRTLLHRLSRWPKRFPVLICSAAWNSIGLQSDLLAFQLFPVRLLRKPFTTSQLRGQVLESFGLSAPPGADLGNSRNQTATRIQPLEFMPELGHFIADSEACRAISRLTPTALFHPDKPFRTRSVEMIRELLGGYRAYAWVSGHHIFMSITPPKCPTQSVICYLDPVPADCINRRARSFPFSA